MKDEDIIALRQSIIPLVEGFLEGKCTCEQCVDDIATRIAEELFTQENLHIIARCLQAAKKGKKA